MLSRIIFRIVAITIASLPIELCIGVTYNEACSTNVDCTDANTYCQASTSSTCIKGTCKCLQHMVWDITDSKCKVKKYFVDKCNTTLTSCQGGTECSGAQGQCICNGFTNNYYAGLQKCIDHASTWKLIGENCSVADDCYNEISGTVECVVPAGSTKKQKKCKCTSGYVEDNSSCRKPHFGEECTKGVGCAQEIAVSESSVVRETCSLNSPHICTCPAGSTRKKVEVDGLIVNICLYDKTGSLLSVGTRCNANNDCESSTCMECPGDTGKKCVAAPSI